MRITAYPRVHIGLIDLAGNTLRSFGGSGFVIEALPVVVEAHRSRAVSIRFEASIDRTAQHQVARLVHTLCDRARTPVRLVLRSAPPQHIGLGSKTSLLLATITAVAGLTGYALSRRDVQDLSGRGGASGVGVNAFFIGGFVADGGHVQMSKDQFEPSSVRIDRGTPPVNSWHAIPPNWRVTLLLPPGKHYRSGSEVEFFRAHTPISRYACLRSLALTYHGVVPAVASADIQLMRSALIGIHRVGFKRAELNGQPPEVGFLLRDLQRKTDNAAGMSSMGPLIYAITDDAAGQEAVLSIAARHQTRVIGTFRGWNKSYNENA